MTAEPRGRPTPGPTAGKRALRDAARAARAALGPQRRATASAQACARLGALPELAGVGPFALYAATGEELDLDPLLDTLLARGARVCLPRVDGDELALCAVDGRAGLVPGWRGVREPASGAPSADLALLRAVVAPGLAFDRAGNRLGYGGGHFDRLLARLPERVVVIGVAFDVQLHAGVPTERHDRPVDIVVTESRVLRVR